MDYGFPFRGGGSTLKRLLVAGGEETHVAIDGGDAAKAGGEAAEPMEESRRLCRLRAREADRFGLHMARAVSASRLARYVPCVAPLSLRR